MKRQEKDHLVEVVTEKVKRSNSIFITNFSGLTVSKTNELRDRLRAQGIDYMVVKNTLIKRSLENVGGYEKLYESLKYPSAVAFGYGEDPVAPARVFKEFLKIGIDKPELKAAFIDGEVFLGNQLDMLAAMPTKDQLIARAMASIQAPASNLVGVMSAVMRNMMYAINQVAEKRNN